MNDLLNSRVSRRRVVKIMGWVMVLPFAGLWNAMVKSNQDNKNGSGTRIILSDIPEGVSYHGEHLISRKGFAFVVFSMRCTHLGCVLKVSSEGFLECPCHGSVFNPADGEPLSGPASRRLQRLNFQLDQEYLMIL